MKKMLVFLIIVLAIAYLCCRCRGQNLSGNRTGAGSYGLSNCRAKRQ